MGTSGLRLLVSPGFPPQQLLYPAEVYSNVSARLHGSCSSHANFPFQDITERLWYIATGFLLCSHQKTPSGLERDIPRPWAGKRAGRWLRGGEHFFIQLQPCLSHHLPVKQPNHFFILLCHPSSFSRVQAAGSTTDKLSITFSSVRLQSVFTPSQDHPPVCRQLLTDRGPWISPRPHHRKSSHCTKAIQASVRFLRYCNLQYGNHILGGRRAQCC